MINTGAPWVGEGPASVCNFVFLVNGVIKSCLGLREHARGVNVFSHTDQIYKMYVASLAIANAVCLQL